MGADQAALETGGALVSHELCTAGLPPLIARALELADAELAAGVCEVPPHSNRGSRVDGYLAGVDGKHGALRCLLRYLGNPAHPCLHCGGDGPITAQCVGAPWCARFAVWCYDQAAVELGVPSPFAMAKTDLAGHYKLLDWATAEHRLVAQPAPGDIGLLIPSPHAGHVVLVAAVDGSDVITREGNHNDRVAAVRRSASSITHYVRVIL